MKPVASALVLVALAVSTTPARVRADYLKAFSGNTAPASALYPGAGVGGVVDFTVLTSKGTPGDTFGTGIPGFDRRFVAGGGSEGLDLAARYLYLYETINNGANGATYSISQNSVLLSDPRQDATSYGTFKGTQFASSVLGPQSMFGNLSPATVGQTPLILSGSLGRTPEILLGTSSIDARFLYGPYPELGAGKYSILWGYTSNVAPTLGTTSIQNGGTSGTGYAPTPIAVPEPLAFFTLAMGLPILRVLAHRRQRPTS